MHQQWKPQVSRDMTRPKKDNDRDKYNDKYKDSDKEKLLTCDI